MSELGAVSGAVFILLLIGLIATIILHRYGEIEDSTASLWVRILSLLALILAILFFYGIVKAAGV